MNGRIYDPTLGRFLQADPFIQAPMNSQNYNRYSYVLNNPLSMTDPSGYIFKWLNKKLGKFAPFVGMVMMFIPGGQTIGGAMLKGFIAGGIATGSLKGAVIGAFSAAAFHQIGQAFDAKGGFWQTGGAGHIGSHALAGGVISDLQGGKFGHGFFSAGLTKAANINGMISNEGSGYDALRIVAAATVGGTISKVTGGKFANGAVTAGFAQAFNGNAALKKAAKQLRKLRRQGVIKAWKDEISLVQEMGKGTREWTEVELDILKDGKVPSGFHGHHINSVKDHPTQAGDPNNIEFLSPEEHFAKHGNNWRNQTVGSLMDRSLSIALGVGISTLEVMDMYSPEGIMQMSAGSLCSGGSATGCAMYRNMGGETNDPNEI